MSCLHCCYRTRKGTAVLHKGAAKAAASWEIWHKDEVAEYTIYKRVTVGSSLYQKSMGDYRFVADEGDTIMVLPIPDRPEWCHALNLTHGMKACINWDDLAHNAKPKS